MKKEKIRYLLLAAVLAGMPFSAEQTAVPVMAEEPTGQDMSGQGADFEISRTNQMVPGEMEEEIFPGSAQTSEADVSAEEYDRESGAQEDPSQEEALQEESAGEEAVQNEVMEIPLWITAEKYFGQPDPDLTSVIRSQILAALVPQNASGEENKEEQENFSAEETADRLLSEIHWEYDESGIWGEEGEYRPEGSSVIRFTYDTDQNAEEEDYRFVLNGDPDNREAVLTTKQKTAEGEVLVAYRTVGLETGPDGNRWGREDTGVSVFVKDKTHWKVSASAPEEGIWSDSVTWNDRGGTADHVFYLRDISEEGNGTIFPAFSESFGIREDTGEISESHSGGSGENTGNKDTGEELSESNGEKETESGEEVPSGDREPSGENTESRDERQENSSDNNNTIRKDSTPEEYADDEPEDPDDTDEAEALAILPETKKTPPIIQFIGLENGRLGSGGNLPEISMDGGDSDHVEVHLYRVRPDGTEEDLTKILSPSEKKASDGTGRPKLQTGVLEQIRENDGIYRMSVDYRDPDGVVKKAGETEFTVNHFGSVYSISQSVRKLQNSVVKKVKESLVITEYNPDALLEGSRHVEITRDGEPLSKVRFTVKDRTAEIAQRGGKEKNSGSWHVCDYIIDSSNFRKDGIYKVVVSSADQAGNQPESQTDKSREILFRVDSTPPELVSLTGLEKKVIRKKQQDVTYEAFDAMGLKSVEVQCGNRVIFRRTDFTDRIRDSGSFQVPAGFCSTVTVAVTDLAGNTAVNRKTVTVSENPVLLTAAELGKIQLHLSRILIPAGLACAGGILGILYAVQKRGKKRNAAEDGKGKER